MTCLYCPESASECTIWAVILENFLGEDPQTLPDPLQHLGSMCLAKFVCPLFCIMGVLDSPVKLMYVYSATLSEKPSGPEVALLFRKVMKKLYYQIYWQGNVSFCSVPIT